MTGCVVAPQALDQLEVWVAQSFANVRPTPPSGEAPRWVVTDWQTAVQRIAQGVVLICCLAS